MGLFQCENCGCVENTADSDQGCKGVFECFFSWEGIEDKKGKLLCSACAPTMHSDGSPTEFGKWHGKFDRQFLAMGEWKTNQAGNLEHIDTGETDYYNHIIRVEKA